MHAVFPLKAISAVQRMSHDWIKKNTGGFCVGVFGEGGAGGWVSERKLLKEYHQCGKGAEQAIRHSRWPSNLVPKLRPRFATFASTQTHEGPPPKHAYMQTHRKHVDVVEARVLTKSHIHAHYDSVGTHKHTCTHTRSSYHQFSYLSVLGERWFGTAQCFDH